MDAAKNRTLGPDAMQDIVSELNDTREVVSDAEKSSGKESIEQMKKMILGFVEFDMYPWQFDKDFLHGALQITKGLDRSPALKALLQARVWWYQSKTNQIIDLAVYLVWDGLRTTRHCEPKNPNGGILAKINAIQKHMSESEEKRIEEESAKIPAWQKYANKANLHLKANQTGAAIWGDRESIGRKFFPGRPRPGVVSSGTAEQGWSLTGEENLREAPAEDAPYPEQFKLVAEAVISNKPIPGVKLIPDTVLRPTGVTPIGAMRAPLKPWERNRAAVSTEAATSPSSTTSEQPDMPEPSSILANVLDKDFPPLDQEVYADAQREEYATMMEG